MALGSFTHGALADLTLADLDRMLQLDETLFVEHKGNIGEESAHGLVRSVAAFANTLGGWLLLGVRDGLPLGEPVSWASPGAAPTLVDVVRDRLRGELDPLPAFEARVLDHPDGLVGVVRVYESADTPHVTLASGSVFVREVAGVSDAAIPRRPGGGARGERAYRAAQVRSRGQLLDLADRGRRASERVQSLVDPGRPLPLVAEGLALRFESTGRSVMPQRTGRGGIYVRMAPYTLSPRFRDWATTADAATAVLAAAEELSGLRGLANGWVIPETAGARVEVGLTRGARHADATGIGLESTARVVLDGAGVVGAALELEPPEDPRRRTRLHLRDIQDLIRPVAEAAARVLGVAELLGRSWCQVDLVGLPAVLLPAEHGSREAGDWVPTGSDLALPASPTDLGATARRAATAYGRSAGLPMWDEPSGM